MSKTNLYKMLMALIIVAVAVILWQQYPDDEANDGPQLSGLPIKAGNGFWPGDFWLSIAQNKGWFVEVGLNVELVDIADDYVGSLTDMAEGRLDSNGFSLFNLISFRIKGYDLVAVFLTDESTGIDAVVARAGIENLSELKGKRVGVEPGSYLEDMLDEALKQVGIDPSQVVKIDTLAEKAHESLASGQVDAVVSWEPVVSKSLELNGSRKLFDSSQIKGISPAVRAFHRSFIDQRPADVQSFVGVWQRATDFIYDYPDEAFTIIAEARGVSVDTVRGLTQIDIIARLRDNLSAFSEGSGYVSLHGRARKINNFFIGKGVTEQRMDSLDFLDGRFVRALRPVDR